jgi:glycosyltransferase involved in cell wall biosynthesis
MAKAKNKKSLKIGFFTDTYTPQVNGVVISINTFRRELEKLGHTVYIFAPGAPGCKDKKGKSKIFRFQSIQFAFQKEYRIALPFSLEFINKFPRLNLDIVHSHTPFSLGVLAEFVARIKHTPLVHTYHTLYPEYVKSYIWGGKVITPKMAEKLSALYCNRCDAICVPSPKMEYLLKKYGVRKKIVVLPSGINLQEFKQKGKNNIRKKYKIPEDSKVLIFVGRAGKEKNIDFLIKAFTKINKKFPNTFLLLVTEGPYKSNLLCLIKKLGLQKKVIITGYLQKPDVIKAYYTSDIFVFASKTETQGLVLLEAMACGLPVVAVSDSAYKKVLQDKINGYATKNNLNDFTQKVINLLTDHKKYNKMSNMCKKTVLKFTALAQAKKLVDTYQDLIIAKKNK